VAGGQNTLVMTITLTDDQLDEIARRAAALVETQPAPSQPWLDVTEAARYLGYASDLRRGKRRLYDLVARNELPCRRDGRRLLFRSEWLDAYLEQTAA
jgi:excisionase family DNA binding protein